MPGKSQKKMHDQFLAGGWTNQFEQKHVKLDHVAR